MSQHRRDFFRKGAMLAAGGLLAAGVTAEPADAEAMTSFSRYRPSHGGSPDSRDYLGKMVSGLRGGGLPPVPLQTPDIKKLTYEMQDGRKTFRLSCDVVKREFLPGNWMDVWGFNQSMPGPTIECIQGDRVRFIVKNNLPEPTSVHWHGLELPNEMDGVPGITQEAIPPGGTFVYEFDLHQVGSFFYHPHMGMQEAMGMVGWLIIHPKVAYDPVCDRDFGLIFQNFFIEPNQTIPDTRRMDWNWHVINGRSGPYTTPLLVKHGERVRIRVLNFSPEQHHPVHMHGHTFWLTGTEGGRVPTSAWVPRNNTLVGVATVSEFEFVANNLGDWILHCHMFHHMMNHMTYPAGPQMRMDAMKGMEGEHGGMQMKPTPQPAKPSDPMKGHDMKGMKGHDMKGSEPMKGHDMKGMKGMKGHSMGDMKMNVPQMDSMDMQADDSPALTPGQVADQQKALPADLDQQPPHDMSNMKEMPEMVPGYPEKMMDMGMPSEVMMKVMHRKEVAGLRQGWMMAMMGMMTVIRVLPPDLYDRIQAGDSSIKPGEIYQEVIRRRKQHQH